MKYTIYKTVGYLSVLSITLINNTFFVSADGRGGPTGLLNGVKDVGTKENGKSASERIREGDLHLEDIPNVIKGLIDIFIGLAGTIAVVFVIYGAYRLMFGSLKGDPSEGKKIITMALTGFVISILSWFIVKVIFDNLV